MSSLSPVQSSPVQSSPVQSSPVQSSPVQSSPVQSSPVQSSPVQSSPVQSSPVQSSPVQSSPVQSSPVQSSCDNMPVLNRPDACLHCNYKSHQTKYVVRMKNCFSGTTYVDTKVCQGYCPKPYLHLSNLQVKRLSSYIV